MIQYTTTHNHVEWWDKIFLICANVDHKYTVYFCYSVYWGDSLVSSKSYLFCCNYDVLFFIFICHYYFRIFILSDCYWPRPFLNRAFNRVGDTMHPCLTLYCISISSLRREYTFILAHCCLCRLVISVLIQRKFISSVYQFTTNYNFWFVNRFWKLVHLFIEQFHCLVVFIFSVGIHLYDMLIGYLHNCNIMYLSDISPTYVTYQFISFYGRSGTEGHNCLSYYLVDYTSDIVMVS